MQVATFTPYLKLSRREAAKFVRENVAKEWR
jgi:hypothetical protein